tara:strand:+ start:574 stop:1290 length:717 start_codon:yes stop_codon:yes gene_type:complete
MRCSFCHRYNYDNPHNRLGCPERKAYIVKNPDSWEAQKDKSRKARAKKRKCSYCAEKYRYNHQKCEQLAVGHNRRSCKELKTDKANDLALCRKWREDFRNAVKSSGLGIGALISAPDYQTTWSPGEEKYIHIPGILLVTDLSLNIGLGESSLTHKLSRINNWENPRAIRGRWVHDNQPGHVGLPALENPNYANGQLINIHEAAVMRSTIIAPGSIDFDIPDRWVHDEEAIDYLYRRPS